MIKKTNIMSLSIEPEMQDFLKKVAKNKHSNVSKLIRDLVEKYLAADEETVDTVILKIPTALKSDPEALRKWLEVRSAGIVKALAGC